MSLKPSYPHQCFGDCLEIGACTIRPLWNVLCAAFFFKSWANFKMSPHPFPCFLLSFHYQFKSFHKYLESQTKHGHLEDHKQNMGTSKTTNKTWAPRRPPIHHVCLTHTHSLQALGLSVSLFLQKKKNPNIPLSTPLMGLLHTELSLTGP